MNEVKSNTPKVQNAKITPNQRTRATKKPLSADKIERINEQIKELETELKEANTAFAADPNNEIIEANRLALQMRLDSLKAQLNTNGLF